FALPRPLMGRKEPDFSLSGLKTAVRIEAEKIAPLSDTDLRDLCASFQAAIVDSIMDRTRMAFSRLDEMMIKVSALVIAGGVAANHAIRSGLEQVAVQRRLPLVAPPPALCTDNGAMIAWAGLERLSLGLKDGLDFAPRARWPLTTLSSPERDAHVR
ncbi:MAG: tRNA (adenosine(37)-N6)-threonylcarbamoyltransferase complex transferase subunit TsaD, partial [Betaproteobacteria bacterium]|nr:tRNA (adenosine(37)-N6)-threonylcarbamoyltransferase complex transferase subunit TsaD [Betaproteobacteria bacterium]